MDKVDGIFSNSKIFCHGDRIREYIMDGHTKSPVTVEIDLTNNCNNKCPKCTGQTKDKKDVDYSLIIKILGQLKDVGVRGIILTGGGEPLLYKDIVTIVKTADKLGLDVGLITSGQNVFLTDDDLKSILKYLKWIRISLDAGSPEHYLDTHGLSSEKFEYVIEFIHKLYRIKERNKLELDIGIGYLICLWDPKEEKKDIDKCVRLVSDKNLNYIQLRPYHNNIHNVDYLNKTKSYIKKKYPNTKLYNTSISRDEYRIYSKCHGSRFNTIICPDASVYYCCLTRNNEKFKLGNLLENTFKEIWTKENLEKIDKKVKVVACPSYCKNNIFNNRVECITEMNKSKHRNFL